MIGVKRKWNTIRINVLLVSLQLQIFTQNSIIQAPVLGEGCGSEVKNKSFNIQVLSSCEDAHEEAIACVKFSTF